jgi:DNA-binding MarR family transcriptional regulator
MVTGMRKKEARRMPGHVMAVLSVLEHAEGPLSTKEVKERTVYAFRTIRTALQRLREKGMVATKIDPRNPRRSMHVVVTA